MPRGERQGSNERRSDALTAAEKQALADSTQYSFPMRRGPVRKKVLTSSEFEEYGLEEPMYTVEMTEQNSDARKQKMTEFFDMFWMTHRGLGLYAKWATLGRVLGGPEKELWSKMDKDAKDLPFHATPEMWRSPAGRFMSCRRKDESDPFALLRNLLTDGGAVYCVYFPKEENGQNVFHSADPTVCYLNLPLNDYEKRMRDFGPKPCAAYIREPRVEVSRGGRWEEGRSVQPEGGQLPREERRERSTAGYSGGYESRGRRPEMPTSQTTRSGAVSGARVIGGDSAYGMVEPFGLDEIGGAPRTPPRAQTRSRSGSPERCEFWQTLRGNYRARRGCQGVGRDGAAGRSQISHLRRGTKGTRSSCQAPA